MPIHVATQASLPSGSARIHHDGAGSSLTSRPPAASAAETRASAWSCGTHTSTCIRPWPGARLLEVLEADHGLPAQAVVQLAIDLIQTEHGPPEREDRGRGRRPDVEHQVPDPRGICREALSESHLGDGPSRGHVAGAESIRSRPERVQAHHDASVACVEIRRVVRALGQGGDRDCEPQPGGQVGGVEPCAGTAVADPPVRQTLGVEGACSDVIGHSPTVRTVPDEMLPQAKGRGAGGRA